VHISVFKDVPVTRNQDCVGLPCPEVVDPAKDGSEFPTKIQQPLASAAEAVRQPARVRHDCLVNLGEVVRAIVTSTTSAAVTSASARDVESRSAKTASLVWPPRPSFVS